MTKRNELDLCLWGERCGLFKACAHSVERSVYQRRFCPTYRGPYCGYFVPKEKERKGEK